MVADDMGLGDTTAYLGARLMENAPPVAKTLRTPNLDAFSPGVTFEQEPRMKHVIQYPFSAVYRWAVGGSVTFVTVNVLTGKRGRTREN